MNILVWLGCIYGIIALAAVALWRKDCECSGYKHALRGIDIIEVPPVDEPFALQDALYRAREIAHEALGKESMRYTPEEDSQ